MSQQQQVVPQSIVTRPSPVAMLAAQPLGRVSGHWAKKVLKGSVYSWFVLALVGLGFLVTLIGIAAVSFTMWLPTIRG